MFDGVLNRRVLCASITVVLCLSFFAFLTDDAKACYWYQISCEGKSYEDYDGGATDVEYHSITCNAVKISPGGNHVYNLKFEYSPGCGAQYSGYWIILDKGSPPGWTWEITDTAGANIYAKPLSWSGSGAYNCKMTVAAPSSAANGDKADLWVHLWTNDTGACNEHNTLDVKTTTQVEVSGPTPLTVAVVAPNGGENWKVGTSQTIKWSAGGGVGTVTIDLALSTTGSSGTWTDISLGETNDGTYTWSVPNLPSTNCFIKAVAKDTNGSVESDTSNAAFTISKDVPVPNITLNAPNGGENWFVGASQSITWTAGGGTGALKVDLFYSTTGSSGSWKAVASGQTSSSYTWTVPNDKSTNCFVKATVTDSGSPPQSASDASNAAFTIKDPPTAPPTITVNTPNGGEKWTVGTIQSITWMASGGTGTLTIKLEYSSTGSSGTFTTIATGEANDGIYSWTVPNTPSMNCFVRGTVTDSGTPPQSISDMSNLAFEIVPTGGPPSITLTSPIGGEKWSINTNHDVTWNAGGGTGTLTIKLEYSTTGSSGPWTTIATGESNDGKFTWMVPNQPSTNCFVKATVTDTASPPKTGTDTSPAAFTITTQSMPVISVLTPNGGEMWTVGATRDILWIGTGGTGTLSIRLAYSTTGYSGPWYTITNSTENDGKYTWTIPDTPSSECFINVIATDQATPPVNVIDRSDFAFTITVVSMPSITILSPNGGESWEALTSHDITWVASGGTGTLLISFKYSTNGLSGPWALLANDEENDGVYNWNSIPNSPSDKCYLLAIVSDSASPKQLAGDTSNGPFSITNATKGIILGVVEDGSGKPIQNALVTLFKSGVVYGTKKSGVDGSYVFMVSGGSYELNASCDGYYPSQKYPVSISAGATEIQDFQLSKKEIVVPPENNEPEISQPLLFMIVGIVLLLILLPMVAMALIRRRKKSSDKNWTTYGATGPQSPRPPPP